MSLPNGLTHAELSLPQVRNPTGTCCSTTPLSSVNSDTTAIDWDGIRRLNRLDAIEGACPGE